MCFRNVCTCHIFVDLNQMEILADSSCIATLCENMGKSFCLQLIGLESKSNKYLGLK